MNLSEQRSVRVIWAPRYSDDSDNYKDNELARFGIPIQIYYDSVGNPLGVCDLVIRGAITDSINVRSATSITGMCVCMPVCMFKLRYTQLIDWDLYLFKMHEFETLAKRFLQKQQRRVKGRNSTPPACHMSRKSYVDDYNFKDPYELSGAGIGNLNLFNGSSVWLLRGYHNGLH